MPNNPTEKQRNAIVGKITDLQKSLNSDRVSPLYKSHLDQYIVHLRKMLYQINRGQFHLFCTEEVQNRGGGIR